MSINLLFNNKNLNTGDKQDKFGEVILPVLEAIYPDYDISVSYYEGDDNFSVSDDAPGDVKNRLNGIKADILMYEM